MVITIVICPNIGVQGMTAFFGSNNDTNNTVKKIATAQVTGGDKRIQELNFTI